MQIKNVTESAVEILKGFLYIKNMLNLVYNTLGRIPQYTGGIMSEKEKRILILTGDKEELCELLYSCPTDEPCPKCDIIIPRSEAVQRMAEAMSAPYFNDVHASEVDMLQALAEAALDALVGKNLSALDKLNKVN